MNTGKWMTICIIVFGLISLALGANITNSPTITNESIPGLVIDLTDGSCVIGDASKAFLPVQTDYAMLNIMLKDVRSMAIADDHQKVMCEMLNGDRVKGALLIKALEIRTMFGKVLLGLEQISKIEVMSGTNINARTIKALVMKTGQRKSCIANDDGAYQKGIPAPSPRFTVGTGDASNCIVDNLTGLMWLKNPPADMTAWAEAITFCEGLDGGSGRGGYSDWRLPNVKELLSLIDFGQFNPALPIGHPFISPRLSTYNDVACWSSTSYETTYDVDAGKAWCVYIINGDLLYNECNKTSAKHYIWPVRGGQ
jgi:hypothetical protein